MDFPDNIVIKEELFEFEEPYITDEQPNLKSDIKQEYPNNTTKIIKLENNENSVNYLVEPVKMNNCRFCPFSSINRYLLLKHNLKHLRVELEEVQFLQCDKCKFYFIDKKKLFKHFRLKHPSGNTVRKCYLCKKSYSHKYLSSHLSDVHGTGNYKCDICFLTFKCFAYLRKHINKHTGKYNLKNQQRAVMRIENRPEVCPKPNCRKIFFSKPCLAVHLRNLHTEGSFKCDLCPSVFKCKSYLYTHKRRVHYDDGRIHPCTICGKPFKSPRYMNIHIKNSHLKNKFQKGATLIKKEPSSDSDT